MNWSESSCIKKEKWINLNWQLKSELPSSTAGKSHYRVVKLVVGEVVDMLEVCYKEAQCLFYPDKKAGSITERLVFVLFCFQKKFHEQLLGLNTRTLLGIKSNRIMINCNAHSRGSEIKCSAKNFYGDMDLTSSETEFDVAKQKKYVCHW